MKDSIKINDLEISKFFNNEANKPVDSLGAGFFDEMSFVNLLFKIIENKKEKENDIQLCMNSKSLIEFKIAVSNSMPQNFKKYIYEFEVLGILNPNKNFSAIEKLILSQIIYVDVHDLSLNVYNKKYDIILNNGLIRHENVSNIYIFEENNLDNFGFYRLYF